MQNQLQITFKLTAVKNGFLLDNTYGRFIYKHCGEITSSMNDQIFQFLTKQMDAMKVEQETTFTLTIKADHD